MISYELLGTAICSAVCKVISVWTQPSPFLSYSGTLCGEIPFAREEFHYRMNFRGTLVPKYLVCAYHVKHLTCVNRNCKKLLIRAAAHMLIRSCVTFRLADTLPTPRYCPELFGFCSLRPQTCCYAVHTISVLLSTLISFILPLYHREH